MAQVGYTPISLYYSSTPAATPLAANLTDGELALNTADGKLFYKNSSGVVQLLASTATAAQTFSAGTTGLTPSSPTTGTITLGGTLVTANGGTGFSSYAIGDILFANTTTALAKLPIGSPEMVLIVHPTNGKPTWTNGLELVSLDVLGGITSIDYLEVNIAASFLGPVAANSSFGTPGQVLTSNGPSNPAYWSTPATSIANLSGGTAGALPYQTSASNTTFLPLGTSGQVLVAGASAPQYVNQSTLSVGSATQVSNIITFNNGGAGALSGTTFNGSAARTISYNTIGAPSTTGTNASGTWAISITGSAASATSASSATQVSNSVTFNNSGSGAASGTTFNGSAAQTISYNTVGAPSTTGTNASGTWAINITGSAASATTAISATSATTATTATNATNAANATNASNLVTTNWTVLESGGFLYFRYAGVNKARLDSSGNFVVTGNVTAFGSI